MRIPILALLLLLLLLLPAAVLAQKSVDVHTPEGDVVAFASQERATGAPENPVVPKNGVATVSVAGGETMLYVWDRAINRLASTPIKGGEWSPRVADMVDLAQVVVQVRRDGKPVAAATVTLDDGRRKMEVPIDPDTKGDATFFDVKPGSLKATVRYSVAGKRAEPVTQIFTAKAEGGAAPRFTVALPEAAAVLGDAAAPEKKAAKEAAAPTAPGGGFNFVGTLFALLVGGGAAAGLYYFIKKNPDTVGGTLEKLGAQIPKPGDADLLDPPVAAAPAPVAKAPEPPQKIVLDPVADPIQMPVPVAVAVSEPSLVSEAGVPIPLAEGETVVGREVGLGLSLAGETTVSRRHARLVRSGSSVTVSDEGSTNGTFVNGAPAGPGTPLRPGDSVQFGSVRFRYEA